MRTSASALGATQNPSKIAPSKESFKNKSQSQILNSRKPLQAIDKNLAATRVQPSRQAKRKQQKAFDIFQDEENKSESFENVSPKAGASKGDRKQVQQKKIGLTTSAVSTTACAAPSAAPFASSSATALMCPSIAASSLTSGPHFGAKISVALAVDPLVGAASSVAADVPSSSHRNDTIDLLSSPVSMDMSQLEKSLPHDGDDSEDKLMEELYSEDIYRYLLTREKTNAVKPKYMNKQTDINHRMRTILIDWLIEVSEEMQLHAETLYLTVNLLDRFLSKMSVLRGKLQLVGAAALLVATKYEEIYPPAAKDLIYLTDDCYSVEQLFRMEDLLLKVVNFDVSQPTPEAFLVHVNKFAESDEQTATLSRYIVELTLMQGEFYLSQSPSILSAAAVCVARHTLGYLPWSEELTDLTSYSKDDLRECTRQLTDIQGAVNHFPKTGVREKYSQVKYHEVAFYNPPSTYPL